MIETTRTDYQPETVIVRSAIPDYATTEDVQNEPQIEKWPLWMRSWFLIFLVVSSWSLIGIAIHALVT